MVTLVDKDWEILVTLYNEGSINKAAQKLFISQPALTYRLKQIEKEFNTQIVHRGNKGVIFTYQGEQIVHYAKLMLKELSKLRDNLENAEKEFRGILRLGVSTNFALYRLPSLLEGFLKLYPNIEIQLKTGWSSQVFELLRNDDIHIVILRGEHNWSDGTILLEKENLFVASKEKFQLDDLPSMNMIKYKTDFGLKNTFDEWWQKTFTQPPKISMEVDRIETCKELVKKGLGYAIFPSISLKEQDQLYTIKLEIDHKPIWRETYLLYREDYLELKVVSAFVNFIKNYYHI